MNADDVNTSVSKPAISTAEAVGSNPAPAPPKSNKRKNHRGGRKTKKKQNLSTAQNLLTAAKDVAVTSNVEATIPELAEKQKPMKGKRCRKSAKAPCETTITAPDTMGRRQDDVAIRILKQHCISPTAQDDSTRPCHHSADPSTLEISPSRHVNKDFGARAGTSKAISVVKQESVSRGEGASGDVAIHGRDGLEAGSKGVATVAETSQGEYQAISQSPLTFIRSRRHSAIRRQTNAGKRHRYVHNQAHSPWHSNPQPERSNASR